MKKIKMFRGHDSLIESAVNEFFKEHQDIIVEDIKINIDPNSNSYILLTILYEEK